MPHIQYWDVNNLYGWLMSQKVLLNSFECIKDTSQYNKDFIKNYNEESDEWFFLKVDVQYPKITWPSQWFTIFIRKNENWKKSKSW